MATLELDIVAIKQDALGGAEAARLWNRALSALHDYAQASGAPAGEPVAEWFSRKGEQFTDSLGRALGERQRGPVVIDFPSRASRA